MSLVEKSDLSQWAECPICLERFTSPVVASDGFTYDLQCIQPAIDRSFRSPMTGEPLIHTRLTPNFLMCQILDLPLTPLRSHVEVPLNPQTAAFFERVDRDLAALTTDRTQTQLFALAEWIGIVMHCEQVLQRKLAKSGPGSLQTLARKVSDAVDRVCPPRLYTLEDFGPQGAPLVDLESVLSAAEGFFVQVYHDALVHYERPTLFDASRPVLGRYLTGRHFARTSFSAVKTGYLLWSRRAWTVQQWITLATEAGLAVTARDLEDPQRWERVKRVLCRTTRRWPITDGPIVTPING